MKPIALLALLPLALAAPSLAKDPTPEPKTAPAPGQPSEEQAQAKPKKPEGEKKICHREIVTGSIRSVRVCRTQSQIDAEQAAGDQTLEDLQRMARIQ